MYRITEKDLKGLIANGYKVIGDFPIPTDDSQGGTFDAGKSGDTESLIENACALIKKKVSIPFRREYKFDPTRRWKFDIAWPELMVAVEIHGGVYDRGPRGRGRHVRPEGFMKDREKMNKAIQLGWRVFEYGTAQVNEDMAIQVADYLTNRGANPILKKP